MGFGFSAYLTYREVFTIRAICSWCAASAVVFTALAMLSSLRLVWRRQEPAPLATMQAV